MVSSSSKTLVDELFSTDDRLQRGKPFRFFGFQNDVFKDVEPSPDLVPLIDPKYISRCCIEHGRILVVPGEFAPTLENVDNLLHLPIVGNVDPFYYDIYRANVEVFNVLKKSVPTSPSKCRVCKDANVKLIPLFENLDFPSLTEKSLALLALSVPFLGEDSKEKSDVYAPFLSLSTIWLWTSGNVSLPLLSFMVTATKVVFHLSSHSRLVLNTAATTSSSKRHCPPTAERGNVFVDSSQSVKKSRTFGDGRGKPIVTKALVALAGPSRKVRGAQVSASSGTPKPAEYLDINDASEEERNTSDVTDDKVVDEDQEAKESVENDDVSEEEPSGKSGGKVNGSDVNFDDSSGSISSNDA
ncbi:hypothetical protein D8674_005935 [Pyrus ussuriensis x Pyrus communis]|uniref:Uncharacterized protein n=1 Tax=Pyrus ussuriensis x Pyrus communis TaxID=2448454 RepID=A0A5N5FSU4_9ROSA|nr:hypothetical protein D8674_005935 [Pyrus ussuriensis x Pyrus communis]